MRIDAIALWANNEEVINLNLSLPSTSDKYLLKAIDGLDADEITPTFYGFNRVTRDRFFNFAMPPRNVAMRVQLNPNFVTGQSYSALRDELYRAISSNRNGFVELRFKDQGVTKAFLSGYISKFEVPHSSEIPEALLTIHCADGTLKSPNETHLNPTTVTLPDITVIDNLSTAPHGFNFVVKFLSNQSTFSIQDAATPTWKFTVTVPTNQFQTNDTLHISSVQNGKDAYRMRDSTKTFMADRILTDSEWPLIFPGENTFYIVGDVSLEDLFYRNSYWGV